MRCHCSKNLTKTRWALLLLCPLALMAHAQDYYGDTEIASPLSHGSDMTYRVDGAASSQPGAGPSGQSASPQASTQNTAAGVKTAVRELEAGLQDLKSYSVDMGSHLQQNGLQGFIDMPQPLVDQGAAIGGRLGRSIQAVGSGVQQDMLKK